MMKTIIFNYEHERLLEMIFSDDSKASVALQNARSKSNVFINSLRTFDTSAIISEIASTSLYLDALVGSLANTIEFKNKLVAQRVRESEQGDVNVQ